jgi:hypothetical protein
MLGLAKTQWYGQWIKTGALRSDTEVNFRELHIMQEFLETVSFTSVMFLFNELIVFSEDGIPALGRKTASQSG